MRYERRSRTDGRFERPDVAEAIEIRRLWIAGGDAYTRRLTSEQRHAVLDAKGDRCLMCGEAATEIDHIDGGGTDELDNLQPLCSDCHRKKSLASAQQVGPDDPQYNEVRARLWGYDLRVLAPSATRPCDDELRWPTVQTSVRRARKSVIPEESGQPSRVERKSRRG
ncbi:MAG: HNH endonuclease signature motif containing protein [Dehalococcoidia bacterium]